MKMKILGLLLGVVLLSVGESFKVKEQIKVGMGVEGRGKEKEKEKGQMMLQEINPTRPLVDERKFFFGKLSNELEVLIINDQSVKKSQVGLGVNIGSMVNPKRIHGLAHLLEHMLFTGTEKYENRTALSECVSKYQGVSNSKTTAREQQYDFELTEDGLLECLDIFGNFFIKPLLKQENILQEISTVESEHLNNINTQPRAQYYALKLLINKHHPYSKFFTGNKDTLLRETLNNDINVQKELINFFQKYYSANIMKLVIISKQSPQYLYEKLSPLFSQIKNLNLNINQFNTNRKLFRDYQYVVKYVAKKQVKVLNVFFDVPYTKSYYVNKSLYYIFEFLKSNSETSFKRYLKEHDFIYGFDCYVAEYFEENMIVSLEFRLTKEGYKNMEGILQTLFDYLTQISKDDLERDLYESLKYSAEAQFKFSQKNQDILQIISSFQNFPLNDILYHEYNYQKFIPIQVLELLQYFDKDKAQYTIGNNRFEFKKHLQQDYFQLKSKFVYNQHKRFQLLYQIIQNPMKIQEGEEHSFTVPITNKYIPPTIGKIPANLMSPPQTYYDNHIIREMPQMLSFKNNQKLWHLKVTSFQLPVQIIDVKMSSPSAALSAHHQALNKMLVVYLNHLVQENFSEAIRLDNIYSLAVTSSLEGILLSFKGHYLYLKDIITNFIQLTLKTNFDQRIFALLKSELEQEFYNTNKQQAIVQAFNKLKQNLYNQFFLDSQLKKELLTITLEELQDYKQNFFQNLFVEAFCTGFIEKADCQSTFDSAIINQLSFNSTSQKTNQTQIKNLDNKNYDLILQNSNQVDNNQAFLLYVQCGSETMYNKVILEIIANKIDQLAYDVLNTQKQLGYITFAKNLQLNNILGFVIGVQGHSHNLTTYKLEVKHFLNHMLEYFQNIEVDQFFSMKKSYIDSLSQSDFSLEQNKAYFWEQIKSNSYNFEEKNQKLQISQSLQLENVLDFIENKFEQGMLNIKVYKNSEFTKASDQQQTKQIMMIESLKYFEKTNPYQ